MHSNLVMYLACFIGGLLSTMNLWVDKWSHMRLSVNDLYMALVMTGWMFLIMGLYYLDRVQIGIGIITVILSLIGIRGQVMVNESEYLRGMIPHHSMALMISKRIGERTGDKGLREFARGIVEVQGREIMEMEGMLNKKC